MGGFDLDAAQAVAGCGEVRALPGARPAHPAGRQVAGGGRRQPGPNYDTGCWRRCASTRWKNWASPARPTPCAPVTATTTRPWRPMLDTPARAGHERRIEQAETDIDNLRAAFAWSRENSDIALALQLASSLQPLWLTRGRIQEGLAWFDAALADQNARHARGGTRRSRPRAGRQGRARRNGGSHRQHGSGRTSPGDRTRNRRPGPAGPGAHRLRQVSPPTTPRWPGRTSPRRSAWPAPWATGGG